MNQEQALDVLRNAGLAVDAELESWAECLELLAALDAIGRDGATALVKIDGARIENHYTVVISGGRRMGEDFFRRDGPDLPSLLRSALAFYAGVCSRDS